MIKKFILTPLRLLPSHMPKYSLKSSLSFCFSTNQQPEGEAEGELDKGADRAANFYRNSVRRININDKGRGKFTEHHLVRLIKLTEHLDQTQLLFEAYYNYLGHFTVISNSTVDKMLLKVLTFPNFPLSSVLEVYQNHNYLAYYPGYAVTKQLLVVSESNPQALGKVLLMLSRSPLVKWDEQIVHFLLDVLKKDTTPQLVFSTTIKLLAQRQVLNILGLKLTNLELLSLISQRIIQRYETVGVYSVKPSQFLVSLLNQIKEKEQLTEDINFQLALVSLTFGVKQNLYEHIIAIKDKQKQQQLFGYFKQVNPLFITQAAEYFHTFQLSEELKAHLQALRSQQ